MRGGEEERRRGGEEERRKGGKRVKKKLSESEGGKKT